MSAHHEALARTALLLNRELFDGRAEEAAICDGLLASTLRLTGDRKALSNRGGQTALITAFSLIARLGIGIELSIPDDVALIDRVAPLRGPTVRKALLDLGEDLIPGARVSAGDADDEASETFAFGSDGSAEAISVGTTDTGCRLARGASLSCEGREPFGGLAAGAAIAAIALEAVMPGLEAATGLQAKQPRPSPGPPVSIDLGALFPGLLNADTRRLGSLDAISGGAITNALIFCLLRVPDLHTEMRVIESDLAALSNLNRYALLRASETERPKTALLESCSSEGLVISGIDALFTKETREALKPLAGRVLVGVDDIEARWWVQEEDPGWLAVGATGNNLAQLSVHPRGEPCAGCVHGVPLAPQTIPTISFVSFWAGLLQCCALLCGETRSRNLTVFAFALGGAMPIIDAIPTASSSCPVGCPASIEAHRS